MRALSPWRWLVLTVSLGFTVPILAVGCGGDSSVWDANAPGPKIVVSFAPIFCFAANVAGPDAQVRDVMTTTGPHEFNPSDNEARLLRHADIFFINGLQLDNALADTMQRGSGNKRMKIVDLGSRIPADRLLSGEAHESGHGHDHAHGPHDPHVWLSPDLAIVMTEGIREELKAADAAHAAEYDRRAAAYIGKLQTIKSDGIALLKDKKDRKIVTFHESLSYFARSFDLEIAGVVEKSPGVEPNIDEMNEIVALCLKKNVRLIAVEPQYGSNTSAAAILRELKSKGIADAALVEIDPLETVTPNALTPEWYEVKMRANLAALHAAMK